MNPMKLSRIAAPTVTNLGKVALLSGVLLGFAPGVLLGEPIGKKGTNSVRDAFHLSASDEHRHSRSRYRHQSGGGRYHAKHEWRKDARQDVSSMCGVERCLSEKKYIDGACVLTDSDGDQIFSTFDTRDIDKSRAERAVS